MSRSVVIPTIAAAVLSLGLGLLGSAPALADDPPQDGIPGQSEVDGQTLGNPADQIGGWAAMSGGVAARPFIKRLSVIRGGTETVVIDNAAGVPNPQPVEGTGIGAVIEPYNLCAPGETPGPGQCYSKPNRVSVSIGYVTQDGQLHVDFDSANDTANVDAATVFDLTLGLNTLGQTLRWSWLTGLPSYWKVDNIGQPDATLRVRFSPLQRAMTSNGGGCSQIPVNPTCEFSDGTGYFRTANLLLSLDTTLDAAFTGALFATDKAYIGSLDAVPGPSPQLTYGIAAPATVAGTANRARLWAVLSDAMLLNTFQVPPGSGEPRGIFALDLNIGTDPTTPWARWSEAANGSDGWLINTPQVTVPLARSALPSRSITLTMKRKAAVATVSLAKGKAGKWTVTANAPGTKGSYRLVVSKAVSTKSGKVTQLVTESGQVKKGRVSSSATVRAKVGDRLVVLLQKKSGSTWVYVASAVKRV